MPALAYRYALPEALYHEQAIRRYGFHGTSHHYVSSRVAELLGPERSRRVITAHLGNGCSLAAVRDGQSLDSTMGFTPLEGLVMGTRSGDLDPGVLLYLLEQGLSPEQVNHLLNKQSGLLGLSGLSNDVRTLLAAQAEGHAGAQLALEIFCYRAAKAVAALCVPLQGLDVLAFTGGIGEHAAWIRARIMAHLGWLGLNLDAARNAAVQGEEACISTSAEPQAWVIPTREEYMIAREADLALKKEEH